MVFCKFLLYVFFIIFGVLFIPHFIYHVYIYNPNPRYDCFVGTDLGFKLDYDFDHCLTVIHTEKVGIIYQGVQTPFAQNESSNNYEYVYRDMEMLFHFCRWNRCNYPADIDEIIARFALHISKYRHHDIYII